MHLLWSLIGTIAVGATIQWQPAPGPLLTRWAKEVSPDNVWQAYPRPQLVRRCDWHCLNGLWNYAIRQKDDSRPTSWDGKILVPFCVESALSGVKKQVGPEHRLWYHRSFSISKPAPNRRWLLHFGAVDWEATVWVNAIKVG